MISCPKHKIQKLDKKRFLKVQSFVEHRQTELKTPNTAIQKGTPFNTFFLISGTVYLLTYTNSGS